MIVSTTEICGCRRFIDDCGGVVLVMLQIFSHLQQACASPSYVGTSTESMGDRQTGKWVSN